MLVGENSKEMNFDLGSDKNKSDVLREVAVVSDFPNKSFNLDIHHVHALEEEMKKIEAFKRELPHCMQLLKNAIERLKQESRRGNRVLRNYGEGEGRAKASNDFSEKKNWMSSVQLCTPARNQDSVFHLKSYFLEGEGSGNQLGCKFRNEGGAFLPFKKPSTKEKQGTAAVEGLSLAVPEGEMAAEGDYGNGRAKLQEPHQHQQEQQKKQRRCWSPELHKIFVHALRQLGGAQTATPKQIRELMKVEGLTNDEVKSHLQKYRIHIKRVVDTASSNYSAEQFAVSGSPQGPLLGGKPPQVGCAATGDEDNDNSESLGWKSKLHNSL